ncbi:MAG: response regulator transcription factor [Chloroflexi bacterium]|nr:response regulator transcription factor [Chloroflexota bacterium]
MSSDIVLVVDDELSVRAVITAVLEIEGITVLQAANGTEALRLLFEKRPDLVLLDILMPGKDGREVCRLMRDVSDVPIIMLTALGDEKEKVGRLSDGADDYIAKPFNNNELVARIRALLRRARKYPGIANGKYDDGVLCVDFDAHRVEMNNHPVHLGPIEWRLLEYLVKHKNKAIARLTLLRQIWGPRCENQDNNLKVTMSNLRNKLGDPARHPRYIYTVRGNGYRFQGHD